MYEVISIAAIHHLNKQLMPTGRAGVKLRVARDEDTGAGDVDAEERGRKRATASERGPREREEEGTRLLAGICWLVARETSIVAAGGP